MTATETIVLCQPPRALGVPNPGPFCTKLETWLRLAGLPYEVETVLNPRTGPKGKVPFIRLDGRAIGDSDLIIDLLSERHPELPGRLRRADPAGHVLQRMLEEHLYWTMVYSRWLDDGFERVRQAYFEALPAVIRGLVPLVARRAVRRQLWEQGIGRHSADAIYGRAARDLDAVAALLPATGYLAGTEPGRVDASAFGVLTNIVDVDLPTRLRGIARSHPEIPDYTARMRAAAFPEFAV